MVGLGVVAFAPPAADGGPQAGVIKMPDGNARVAGGRGILAVARGDRLVGSHLARGRKLHGGSQIQAALCQNRAKRLERRRQTDLRMAVAHGDGGQRALRPRQECAVHCSANRSACFHDRWKRTVAACDARSRITRKSCGDGPVGSQVIGRRMGRIRSSDASTDVFRPASDGRAVRQPRAQFVRELLLRVPTVSQNERSQGARRFCRSQAN